MSEQLEAFRKWGTGGEFANFVYGGLDPLEYEDYVGAMQAASSAGTVDETDPTVEIAAAGRRPVITGTATDNLGIKAVRWQDDQGGSGVAAMHWKVLGGDEDAGFEWEMRWSVPVEELSPGRVGADRHRRGHQGAHFGARRRAAGMTGPNRIRGEPGRARPDLVRDLAAGGRWPGLARAGARPLPRRPRPPRSGSHHRGPGRPGAGRLPDPRIAQGPDINSSASRRPR